MGAPARTWESVPGCLRLSDTFMMCHSNNVRETTLYETVCQTGKNLAVDYTGEGLLRQASLGPCTLGHPPLTRVGPGEQAFRYIEMALTK